MENKWFEKPKPEDPVEDTPIYDAVLEESHKTEGWPTDEDNQLAVLPPENTGLEGIENHHGDRIKRAASWIGRRVRELYSAPGMARTARTIGSLAIIAARL